MGVVVFAGSAVGMFVLTRYAPGVLVAIIEAIVEGL